MVEGARLESVYRGNSIEGSNPSLSASIPSARVALESQHVTPKQRMLSAITGGRPDRLPVTTHHVMPYFLEKYLRGISAREFFDEFGFDAIVWTVPHRPEASGAEYYDPLQGEPGFLESRRIATGQWRVFAEAVPDGDRKLTRYRFDTPRGSLSMVLGDAGYTTWVVEPLIKQKGDFDLIERYATAPKCDVAAVNRVTEEFGERGLVRGTAHAARGECFYGYGSLMLGPSGIGLGWPIMMGTVVLTANAWGIATGEWRKSGRQSRMWMPAGTVLLVAGVCLIGYASAA